MNPAYNKLSHEERSKKSIRFQRATLAFLLATNYNINRVAQKKEDSANIQMFLRAGVKRIIKSNETYWPAILIVSREVLRGIPSAVLYIILSAMFG